MELTVFVIILLCVIVLSNVLDSALPSFPLPIIQIGLGALIAVLPFEITIDLKPEIFMGVLIAPLLYREAEEADLVSLWKVRKEVVFMVFGLVFATVFVIGFSAKYFIAAIPLAACFCLGGILGPTDAIAVNSVSNRIDIDAKVMSILKGEFLINDASGVIAFNFAALALTTGAFSIGQASLSFLYICLGGLVVGLLVEAAKNYIVRSLKRNQIRNAAAFMIIELLVPFLCFFIANAVGASGILAAVTAGTRQAFLIRRLDIFEARFAVIKKSLWDMISLVFNSFIFILLGLELPVILANFYKGANYSIGFTMKIGLLVTCVMFAIRYIGIVIAARGLPGENRKERTRNRVVLTLSGVKGTVSLATAFALPVIIAGGRLFKEERDMLLLVAACAIIYSLVIATVLLPIIAKTRIRKVGNEGRIAVLKSAIERVQQTDSDYREAIVVRLNRRQRELELEVHGKPGMRRYRQIRNEFFSAEMELTEQKARSGEYTKEEASAYFRICTMLNGFHNESFGQNRLLSIIRSVGARGWRKGRPDEGGEASRGEAGVVVGRGGGGGEGSGVADGVGSGAGEVVDGVGSGAETLSGIDMERMQDIFWENTSAVILILDKKLEGGDKELLSHVVEERIETANSVVNRVFGGEFIFNFSEGYYQGIKDSYNVEREALAELAKEGRISEQEADDIRVEINMLENYTIEEMQGDIAARLIEGGVRRRRRKAGNKPSRRSGPGGSG